MGNFWSVPADNAPTKAKKATALPPVVHSSKGRLPSEPVVVVGSKRVRNDGELKKAVPLTPVEDGQRHKYCVRNAPYWFNKKAMEKVLKKVNGLPPYQKVHKLPKWDHFFIEFANAAIAKKAVEVLSKTSIKGQRLEVVEVTQESQKRRRIANIMDKARTTNEPVKCISAADVTAPWREIPYEDQIERKKEMIKTVLVEITDALKPSQDDDSEEWLPWVKELTGERFDAKAPCCPVDPFIHAKEGLKGGREYYRNKTELTVGYTISSCADGHKFHYRRPVAGFSAGAIRDGETRVVPVTKECITTSVNARLISDRISKAIAEVEDRFPVYDRVKHVGYWRQVLIRESRALCTVVVITTNSSDVSEAEEKVAQSVVVRHLYSPSIAQTVSLLWHHCDVRSSGSDDLSLIEVSGENHIIEFLNNKVFRVNPLSFFQVNTIMAERMYDTIGDMACLTRTTVVLDICCGTGSIGLSLAHRVARVIGVELNESAVEDARHNAMLNNIRNATFISGRAEDVILDATKMVHGHDCVAIVDPPRAGLHHNVIRAIRGTKGIRRVVYVACEPKNLSKACAGFCRRRSKSYRGDPFVPVKAVGCDMFPHTKHYELLISFKR